MTQIINNENDIDIKVVPKILKDLGYSENDWTSQYPIPAGRTTVIADFLVSSNIQKSDDAINFIIDSKNPDEVLENFIPQVVSYGRLTKSKYSVLLNNKRILVVSNFDSKVIYENGIDKLPDILSKKNYFTKFNKITYSKDEIDTAVSLIKKFEGIKEFNIKFEKCQDKIRNIDGLTGSDAFDELSKLLFVKMHLEDDPKRIQVFSEKTIIEQGVDIIKVHYFNEVKSKFSDIFEPNDEISLTDETVTEIVKILEPYNLKNTEIDVKGRAYEILLGKTFIGSLGQHFTPRTVVNFMNSILSPSSLVGPDYLPKIIDPACGSAGFLIKSLEDMLKLGVNLKFDSNRMDKIKREVIYGSDLEPRSVRVAKMNMTLHGDGKGGIYHCNGLTGNHELNNQKYDFVITNPPFGVKITDKVILRGYKLCPTNIPKEGVNAEILFVEKCINILKEEGKLAILIPDGLINNKSTKHVREFILENLDIDAIISLPDRTFRSANANAVTSILFATKRKVKKNKYIFLALAEEIGFERKTKNAKAIKENDLPNIDTLYKNYIQNISTYNISDKTIHELGVSPKAFLIKYDSIRNSRIDAPYFYATYLYKNYIHSSCVQINKYARVVKRNLTNIESEIRYIEFSSVLPELGIISNYTMHNNDSRPGRAKYLIMTGDLICARMRDSETNIALVPENMSESLASNGFIVLNPIPPMTRECLFYLLRAETNINQVRWKASGTIMPTIEENEYLLNWVPNLTIPEIEKITNTIKPNLDKMFTIINDVSLEISKKII